MGLEKLERCIPCAVAQSINQRTIKRVGAYPFLLLLLERHEKKKKKNANGPWKAWKVYHFPRASAHGSRTGRSSSWSIGRVPWKDQSGRLPNTYFPLLRLTRFPGGYTRTDITRPQGQVWPAIPDISRVPRVPAASPKSCGNLVKSTRRVYPNGYYPLSGSSLTPLPWEFTGTTGTRGLAGKFAEISSRIQ